PSLAARLFPHRSASTEIYTLSLHDALPISVARRHSAECATDRRRPGARPRKGAGLRDPSATHARCRETAGAGAGRLPAAGRHARSEEHTSELQSRENLVCRLLLEKKKKEQA